jgi:hypothetical protein
MIEAHSQDRSFDNSRLTNTRARCVRASARPIMCARSFDTHVVRGWEKGVAEGATRKRPSGGGLFFILVLLQQGGQLDDIAGDPSRLIVRAWNKTPRLGIYR